MNTIETVPGSRLLANAMVGDYREHCDSDGFELEQFKGVIPSDEIKVINGRRKWQYVEEANRKWNNKIF